MTKRPWRNWQTRQVEGLVGVNPVEVQILSAALFFMVFLKHRSFDSGAASLPWWHIGGTVGFTLIRR